MIYTITFNPALDYISKVDNFEIGKINRTKEEKILPGGKGLNVSTVLKNLGFQSTALGFIAGFTGKELKTEIEKYGIQTDFIEVKEGITRINVKISSDVETALNGNGPIITEADIEKLLEQISKFNNEDIVILAGNIPKGIKNNIYEIERILLNMSTTYGEVDHIKLRSDIESILQKSASTDIKDIDTVEFINSMFVMLKENNIKLNKNITMLVRGICVIEGTLESISPDLSLFTVLKNKVKEDSFYEFFSKEAIIKSGRDIISAGSALPKIPNELLNLIKDINKGETKFGIEMTNSDKQVDKVEKMLHQVVVWILDAALLLGASLVNSITLRNIYIILAVILTIWLIIQMIIDNIHKGL